MGDKKVLVVRVTDSAGQAVPEDAAYVSDKIFGTSGDVETMTSQFAACSNGKLRITNEYPSDIDAELMAAPGVIDVQIDVVLNGTDRGTIRSNVSEKVMAKLGLEALPGPFDHVMYVLAGCWESDDCGWAAYAYVNSWNSVYQGQFYKMPAVQMHEIGHNLNFVSHIHLFVL